MRDGSTRRPSTSSRSRPGRRPRPGRSTGANAAASSILRALAERLTRRRLVSSAPQRHSSRNSTSPTTSITLVGPTSRPARQPVPTAARHRAAPATQLVAARPRTHRSATRALGRLSPRKHELNTYGCDCSPRRRGKTRAPLTGPRTALKGVAMLNESSSTASIHTRSSRARTRLRLPSAARQRRTRRRRARRVMLTDPRTAAAVLAPLLADQSVEVFGVACLSTKHRLLAWHVLSRGTRTSTPVSMPDVFVPACLTPGTTGLMVVHNHPSGDPDTERGRCAAHAATVRRRRRARPAAARSPHRR